MTDFDNAKHNLDVLENAKKKDEAKIKKVKMAYDVKKSHLLEK